MKTGLTISEQIHDEMIMVVSLPVELFALFTEFDRNLRNITGRSEYFKEKFSKPAYRQQLMAFCRKQMSTLFPTLFDAYKAYPEPDWIRLYIDHCQFYYEETHAPLNHLFAALKGEIETILDLQESPTKNLLLGILYKNGKIAIKDPTEQYVKCVCISVLPIMAGTGDIEGIQKLLDLYYNSDRDSLMIVMRGAWLISLARGKLDIANYLASYFDILDENILIGNYLILEDYELAAIEASKAGQVESLNYIVQQCSEIPLHNAFLEAAKHGRVEVIDWFYQNYFQYAKLNTENAFLYSSLNHNIKCLQYFFDKASKKEVVIPTGIIEPVLIAAGWLGRKDVVSEILANKAVKIPSNTMTSTRTSAVEMGHRAIVDLIDEKQKPRLIYGYPSSMPKVPPPPPKVMNPHHMKPNR